MQKWDDQTESTMRRKEKIEFSEDAKCERTETHESYLQRHDRSIYKLRYSSDRKSPAFLEVFLRVLHRRSARNEVKSRLKTRKEEKGEKIQGKNSGLRPSRELTRATPSVVTSDVNSRKARKKGHGTTNECCRDTFRAFSGRFLSRA